MKEVIAVITPIVHIILMILGLLDLHRRSMDEIAKVLWAWIVVLVPVLGPIAVFLVRPGRVEKPGTAGG